MTSQDKLRPFIQAPWCCHTQVQYGKHEFMLRSHTFSHLSALASLLLGSKFIIYGTNPSRKWICLEHSCQAANGATNKNCIAHFLKELQELSVHTRMQITGLVLASEVLGTWIDPAKGVEGRLWVNLHSYHVWWLMIQEKDILVIPQFSQWNLPSKEKSLLPNLLPSHHQNKIFARGANIPAAFKIMISLSFCWFYCVLKNYCTVSLYSMGICPLGFLPNSHSPL